MTIRSDRARLGILVFSKNLKSKINKIKIKVSLLNNYFHIAHVSHFTEKSIKNLFNNSGYEIVKFNNSIQLLAKKSSKDFDEIKRDSSSLIYTENLLCDINNNNVVTSIDNFKFIIIYIFRYLKIRKFLEIVKTKIFKFRYR